MAETQFQTLSAGDRRDALAVAERSSGRRAHLLEKDVWVVATLDVLFGATWGQHLTFKGGTSLSKVWGAIRRFSEDIDIVYDIRALDPELVSGAGEDALPPTRSQAKRWSHKIRNGLAQWVEGEAGPVVTEEFARAGFAARVHADAEKLLISYKPLFEESGFVRPQVTVEFGARSTGEPRAVHPVTCDAAVHLPKIKFPRTSVTVMLAERTFWEKAIAIHVYCRRDQRRGERMARHWHDVVRLEEAGIAERALCDHELALSVARHNSVFFSKKDPSGERINYEKAVSGDLQLVPSGAAHAVLAADYARMLADGMLLGEGESFEALMERCGVIEERANSLHPKSR